MPKFIFNKLVRDKLREEYVRLHHRATYRELGPGELIEKLQAKIIEEAKEIPVAGTPQEIAAELADIQQVIDDIAETQGITPEQIAQLQQQKFEKKGGFTGATFVDVLELDEDDEWTAYYRQSPEIFEEIKDE